MTEPGSDRDYQSVSELVPELEPRVLSVKTLGEVEVLENHLHRAGLQSANRSPNSWLFAQ